MLKKVIQLNMNEMPYLPPREVIEAAEAGLRGMNRYLTANDIYRLQDLLATYSGVKLDNIVVSSGSEILLREIIHSFSMGRKIIMISPSFFPTIRTTKQFATKWVHIQLSPPNFHLDIDHLIYLTKEPSLLIIDNPNNPTGTMLLDREAVDKIVLNENTFLVIDEAYYEFSKVTFADMVPHNARIAITRTMDKAFSLAGARIGYLVAGEAFMKPFSQWYPQLSRSSICAAIAALKNPTYMKNNVQEILEEKERVTKTLKELSISAYPSAANFLLFKTEIYDAANKLKDIGILIDDVSNQMPAGFIRVSIGTPDENDAFIKGYLEILDN